MIQERKSCIDLINEARALGAKQSAACAIVGVSVRTYQRWERREDLHDGRQLVRRAPANKLSEQERQRIIDVANDPEYAELSPSKIVPKLADKGDYIASESTFYRVLKAEGQLKHRQKSRVRRQGAKPKALCATGPNQIYSWDITYLPTTVHGIFLYLYLVMDIYSRKIVGWQVFGEESSARAADLMIDICRQEGIERNQVTLHSDNGSPMKGATMLATLHQLGVVPSFSRPSVSNDNPYSEALFRTLKYRPEYPENPFDDLETARAWVNEFVDWYNHQHLHSAINFVTPEQRHSGLDGEILANRESIYEKAKIKNPERWAGNTRNWKPVEEVHLNPQNNNSDKPKYRAA